MRACAARAGVAPSVHTSPLYVVDDAALLELAVDNLAQNAARYAGGAASIGVLFVDDDVILRVTDDGPGIAPDALAHVFDRFYRVDESRTDGGAGLGLAIVKSIAEAHGGRVAAHSRVGAGTTFEIHLPAAPSPASASLHASPLRS